jgi:hypothetical protein
VLGGGVFDITPDRPTQNDFFPDTIQAFVSRVRFLLAVTHDLPRSYNPFLYIGKYVTLRDTEERNIVLGCFQISFNVIEYGCLVWLLKDS